jgi:hypothetical protein
MNDNINYWSRVLSVSVFLLAHLGSAFPVLPQSGRLHSTLSHVQHPQGFFSTSRQLFDSSKGIQDDRFPDDLVTALDLVPVIDMVASYCATHRGQQALYKVVGQDDTTKRTRTQDKQGGITRQFTSRKRQLYESAIPTVTAASFSSDEHDTAHELNKDSKSTIYTTDISTSPIQISPIASSVNEMIDMYRFVDEASQYLKEEGPGQNKMFPPIYPIDATNGPFDMTNRRGRVNSDDDDFLQFTTAKDDGWTLEHVLQADQVIAKLISLYDWSTRLDDDKESTSLLKAMIMGTSSGMNTSCGIDIDRLTKVWSIIHDTVEIVRVRTLTDAWGQTTYQFRLRNAKFPILNILRDRCELLHDDIAQSKGTSSKRKEQELNDMEQELLRKELEIKAGLIQAIHSVRRAIDHGLDILAKIDVIFAKSAFGINMGAEVMSMEEAILSNSERQTIRIEKFVHPLLGQRNDANVVPIDLVLGDNYQALIISGSNGGGKSVAMKSFGLVSVLAKLGVPIIANSIESIRFFDEILVSVGDYQNVERGESTYISQLLRHSALIDRVALNRDKSYLVLLDELGTGTEEAPGGAIGQAVVEKLMETKSCLIVATTHSPILKAWSFNDVNVGSAAVLLQRTDNEMKDHQWNMRPSYRLQYGCIGESYALGAASRCLPQEIVSRAATILDQNSVNTNDGAVTTNLSYNVALTNSLEKQLEMATALALETEEKLQEIASIQSGMMSLANAYDRHLSRLEQRIELCYQSLQNEEESDETDVSVHVLGKTLSELRIVRSTVKREQDILRERGLKRLRDDDELSINQSVVVIDNSSPWNGNTGTITTPNKLSEAQQQLLSAMDVVVVFSDSPWSDIQIDTNIVVDDQSFMFRKEPIVFKRYQLAIWDYNNFWDNDKHVVDDKYASIADTNRKLRGILTKLQSVSTPPKRKIPPSTTKSSQFTSSRERKSAKKKNKKK